ncbi:MAG: hypothetical protein F6K47_06995 [Symploca sp. SIO2E6]|nr:hypothetical protein [Symploca sp. SIO2E6]
MNQQRGKKFINKFSLVTALSLSKYFTRGSLMIASGLLIAILAPTQPVRSQAIFENLTIEPGFSPDPMQVKGFSGGCLPIGIIIEEQSNHSLRDDCLPTDDHITGIAETPTGPCVGFFDQQPDHIVELTTFFDYLSLKVKSPGDTTLAITGPGGTWCSDDSQDKNPVVAGQWLPGIYRIWVGSYERNQYYPYIIQLSQVKP